MCVRCAKRLVVLVAADLALGHLHHPLPRRIDFELLACPTLSAVGTNARVAALTREHHAPATPNLLPGYPHTLYV